MSFEDELLHFNNLNSGWIDPSGTFTAVSLYCHMDHLEKFDDFREDIESHKEYVAEEQDRYAESIPEGEHPEWHCFEFWADDEKDRFSSRLYEKAYGLGWIRVGKWGANIEVQGNADAIKRRKSMIKDIAEFFNASVQESHK